MVNWQTVFLKRNTLSTEATHVGECFNYLCFAENFFVLKILTVDVRLCIRHFTFKWQEVFCGVYVSSVGRKQFCSNSCWVLWGKSHRCFLSGFVSLLPILILSALRESVLVAVCTQSTRYHEPHPWLESAPSVCRAGASFSSNAECCLGFQQCPYLWSFKQVKPLTGSWLLQPRTISGAIRSLLWYPHGQRRFCSNESLLLTLSWSVKYGLPLLMFVGIVAIISKVNIAGNLLPS